jgi:hypothetical protein
VTVPPPIVKAFLVCDYVIHEQGTNKKSCIGIFHRIHAREFPCRHGQLAIYANITDASGEYEFRLTLVDLTDGKEIGKGTTPPLRIPDKLSTAELSFQLQNIVFPNPGKYDFVLYANGEPVARKEVLIVGPKAGGRPPGGAPEA